jgi:hypothetical protein
MSSTHRSPSSVKLTSILSLMISSTASWLGPSIPVTVAVIVIVADHDLVSSSAPMSLSNSLTSSYFGYYFMMVCLISSLKEFPYIKLSTLKPASNLC